MSDYIIEVLVDKLRPHPINETIYDSDEAQLEELMNSIEVNGLLEPFTIDNDNFVYSGHRRLEAVKRLGWVSVKCRLSNVVHPIITIIESNRQRKKTSSERNISIKTKLQKQKYDGKKQTKHK